MNETRKKPPLGFVIVAILIIGALAWLKFYIQRSTLEEAAKELAEKQAAEKAETESAEQKSTEE